MPSADYRRTREIWCYPDSAAIHCGFPANLRRNSRSAMSGRDDRRTYAQLAVPALPVRAASHGSLHRVGHRPECCSTKKMRAVKPVRYPKCDRQPPEQLRRAPPRCERENRGLPTRAPPRRGRRRRTFRSRAHACRNRVEFGRRHPSRSGDKPGGQASTGFSSRREVLPRHWQDGRRREAVGWANPQAFCLDTDRR